jgi:hypothetical protein
MMKLGEEFQDVLENWIRRGETAVGAPIPAEGISGSATGTFDERKSAVLTTLKKSEEFLASICLADERKAPWDITRTTEIRPLTDDAFTTLINHVDSMVNDAGIVV